VTILILIHSPFRMWTIPIEHVERLRREFPGHRFLHALDDEEGLRTIAEADVAFSSQVNPDHLQAAPQLRWIHSPAAGVAGMLYPAMLDRPVIITNARGMSGPTIAEHILSVTLALFRRLPLALRRQAEHVWAQDEIGGWPGNRMVAGSRIAIIGLGAIGSAAAARFHAFGATVIGIRKRVDVAAPPGVSDVRSADDLLSVLPTADVVVIAAAQTRQTRGLIGDRELRVMKPDAILVNVSRGGLVDEDAVAAALREGRLGGAALDVFRHEPLTPDHHLWEVPNVLITPHTSGFRRDHWDAATNLFAENLRRFERGEQLINVVDKRAGY
jgi:phosphoglycerate dehydrogenase-like enzyme